MLPIINEIRAALENSPITKLKQHRLKMLVDDINNNQYRVKSILRLSNSQDDIKNILEMLVREELLSEEQFEKLVKLEDTFDLPAVTLVIKDTKIGQGLKFLPRKMTDLVKSLQRLLTELVETGSSTVRNNVTAVLEELLRRKGITQERYN